jgi:hypothetical protein
MPEYVFEGEEQLTGPAWVKENVPSAVIYEHEHAVVHGNADKRLTDVTVVLLPKGTVGQVRKGGERGFSPIKVTRVGADWAASQTAAPPPTEEPKAEAPTVGAAPPAKAMQPTSGSDASRQPPEASRPTGQPASDAKSNFVSFTVARSNSQARLTDVQKRIIAEAAAGDALIAANTTREKWVTVYGPSVMWLDEIAIDEKHFKALLLEHGLTRLASREGASDLCYLRKLMKKWPEIEMWISSDAVSNAERADWNHPKTILKYWTKSMKAKQAVEEAKEEKEDAAAAAVLDEMAALEKLSPKQLRKEVVRQRDATMTLGEKLYAAEEQRKEDVKSRDKDIEVLAAAKKKVEEAKKKLEDEAVIIDATQDDPDVAGDLINRMQEMLTRERARNIARMVAAHFEREVDEEEQAA